jgi:hypothetical protein
MEARNHWCVHRPGINLSEAFDDTIDERGLGNGNGAVGSVSDDCNPQCILRWSKIRDFPVMLKLFFEQGVFSLGRCCGEDIVNMDGKDDGPSLCYLPVYTVFPVETLEAKVSDGSMECLIPNSAGLFHTIDASHQLHDPGFFAGFLEAMRLFHVCCLFLRQDAVQEGSFDIDLLEVPIESRGEV